jgi:hypothetical protein
MRNPVPRYGLSLACLAVLLLVNTVLGPLGLDLVSYPLSESLMSQLRGLELVTVLLVVPALLLAAGLARRGRDEAALVAIGPCGYTAYMFVQYVVGPADTTYSPALLLHLFVFAASAALTAWSWSLAVRGTWPVPDRARRLRWAALLVGLAAFVLVRYVPLFLSAATGARIPEESASDPGFYWSIVLLDLGIVVPATLAAAVAVLRASHLVVPATYVVVGWFALVPPSVAAMAMMMVARGDPNGSWPTVALLVTVSAMTTTMAVRMFDALLRRSEPPKCPTSHEHGTLGRSTPALRP